ncbi:hypothetical protein FEM48_Zijuj02G0018700 [Ziziphus jujuba var. spinosa]|uniref:Leucine-rich repeat-containing N-terminal plant-type domain-containing protein n=1 Tax=Ziziphus jujuba var. spinosa TaxID=714518 RepID=A0A978VSX6_ZIZJJ|nr:hypothetical protein FEM48_Zijuj02G0018700 [Ziziphus jujuba var. spinosa]
MAASRKALCFAVCVSLTVTLLPLVYGNSEGDALYTLRRSLSDPDNVLQSWDPTLVNPCTWDLGNSNLSGHLVPELGKLEHLQYLYVFPPFSSLVICRCITKAYLIVYHRCLLHFSFASYLQDLFVCRELYKNNIQGTIPSELGNLKSLISLDLYNNNISGVIPPSLGKLKSLVFLRLNDNGLSGPIPKELVGISSLKVVDVSNNNLCGTIPTSGPFEHIPLSNFENNPRLEGPELLGLASYDTNCS